VIVVRVPKRLGHIGAAVSAAAAAAATFAALGAAPAAAGQQPSPEPAPAGSAGGHGSALLSALPPSLRTVVSRLDGLPTVPNTAWGLDPRTGAVTMTVADAAKDSAVARLLGAAHRVAPDVQVEHVPGAFHTQIAGGEGISHSELLFEVVCTAGFDVQIGGEPYVITAGHCTQGKPTWDGLGPSVDSTFPGHDYGLIRNTSGRSNGVVDLHNGDTRPITSAGTPAVGEHVCKSGESTGVTCGTVTALDETVTYADGSTVRGLIATDLRAANGDSGSPLFHQNTGLGTLSGGGGGVEYFQPLPAALQAYGATLAPAHPATEPAAAGHEQPPADAAAPVGGFSGLLSPLAALLGPTSTG
jgi:streptogrisin D